MNIEALEENNGYSLPSSIRGFPQDNRHQHEQNSNPNPNPNPKPTTNNSTSAAKKKRNLPGTPGKLLCDFV